MDNFYNSVAFTKLLATHEKFLSVELYEITKRRIPEKWVKKGGVYLAAKWYYM